MERVFEPFFTTKEPGKGTGLGLAMVYGAIKSHKGVIDVESSSAGTVFSLYLPLLPEGEIEEADRAEVEVVGGKGEFILLADDNASVLETSREVLEGLGYRVITADDGVHAIEQFEAHKDEIDLLILDAVMPRLGGAEALKAIRGINPDVKALFATGYASK